MVFYCFAAWWHWDSLQFASCYESRWCRSLSEVATGVLSGKRWAEAGTGLEIK